MSIGDEVKEVIEESQKLPDRSAPEYKPINDGNVDVFDPSAGSALPSERMYSKYYRRAAQKREEAERRKMVQKREEAERKKMAQEQARAEIFRSIRRQQCDLLEKALSKKKLDAVLKLLDAPSARCFERGEGEKLLVLVPGTKEWELVRDRIKRRTARFPIVHPIRNTKPDDTLNPEDAPNPADSPIPEDAPTSEDALNPGEEPSGTGLKGCLEKAAQGSSTEMQDRPHAKVARSRPVFKRVSGKRGPRD